MSLETYNSISRDMLLPDDRKQEDGSIASDTSGSSNLYDGLSKMERRALKREAASQGAAMHGLNGVSLYNNRVTVPDDRTSLPRAVSFREHSSTRTINQKRFEYRGAESVGKKKVSNSGGNNTTKGPGHAEMKFADLFSDEEEYQRYKRGDSSAQEDNKSQKTKKKKPAKSSTKVVKMADIEKVSEESGEPKAKKDLESSGEVKAKKKGVIHSMTKTIGKVGKNTGSATVKGAKSLAKGGETVVKKTKQGATATAKVTKKGAVSVGTQARKSAKSVAKTLG